MIRISTIIGRARRVVSGDSWENFGTMVVAYWLVVSRSM